MESRLRRFAYEPETAVIFLVWIGHNPLKSPDSDEQNQANPSIFIWFRLAGLGEIRRQFEDCTQ
jgi:hypothetical protein